jgi:hypothetical protein
MGPVLEISAPSQNYGCEVLTGVALRIYLHLNLHYTSEQACRLFWNLKKSIEEKKGDNIEK